MQSIAFTATAHRLHKAMNEPRGWSFRRLIASTLTCPWTLRRPGLAAVPCPGHRAAVGGSGQNQSRLRGRRRSRQRAWPRRRRLQPSPSPCPCLHTMDFAAAFEQDEERSAYEPLSHWRAARSAAAAWQAPAEPTATNRLWPRCCLESPQVKPPGLTAAAGQGWKTGLPARQRAA
jgi:hypothetical protein